MSSIQEIPGFPTAGTRLRVWHDVLSEHDIHGGILGAMVAARPRETEGERERCRQLSTLYAYMDRSKTEKERNKERRIDRSIDRQIDV